MGFKDALKELAGHAKDLADDADKLDNKNLRDILLLGVARFEQAAEHQDSDRVGADDPNAAHQGDLDLNSGGNALFAAGDPGAKLQTEEAQRRQIFDAEARAKADAQAEKDNAARGTPFPGTPAPVPSAGDGLKPGDPAVNFQGQNPDFKAPENVDLNSDGTVKRAPNALGKTDDRDGGKTEGQG
jgi:hypothetical protein